MHLLPRLASLFPPVVIVVSLIVVAGLIQEGVLPVQDFSQRTIEGTPMSYSEAVAAAEARVATIPGAPWQLYFAQGLASDSSASVPNYSPSEAPSCDLHAISTGPTEIPATPSWAYNGSVSLWNLEWVNNYGEILWTAAYNTSVLSIDILDVGTGVCAGQARAIHTNLSSIDSPAAVYIANEHGGAMWLTSHRVGETVLTLSGQVWNVTYSACAPLDLSGTGPAFFAELSASTGTLGYTMASNAVSCDLII